MLINAICNTEVFRYGQTITVVLSGDVWATWQPIIIAHRFLSRWCHSNGCVVEYILSFLWCFDTVGWLKEGHSFIQLSPLVFGWPYYRSCLWHDVLSVCLSVCLSVTFCIVVKRYVLAKKCLKEWIGNQGQRIDFLGRRHISTSGFGSTATKTAVFALFLLV